MKELTVVLVRHESAIVDYTNRMEMVNYCYGLSDPPLSEKGIAEAQATALNLIERLAGKKVVYSSSPMKRALETAAIIAPPDKDVHVLDFLRPVDYNYVPPIVIYKWMEIGNDKVMYDAWIETIGYKEAWKDALKCIDYIRSQFQADVDVLVLVSHDEKSRLLLCALSNLVHGVLFVDPRRFTEDEFKVSRGEAVILTITPEETKKIERIKN